MGRDQARPLVDVHPILGFAHLERTANQEIGHRVAVAVDVDVPLDIDEPVMQRVDLGQEERQGTEVGPFGREELARTRSMIASMSLSAVAGLASSAT